MKRNEHERAGLRVKTGLKAGKLTANHNPTARGLRVRTALKGGKIATNHNARLR